MSHISNVGCVGPANQDFFQFVLVLCTETGKQSHIHLCQGFKLTRVLIVRGDEGSESSWSKSQSRWTRVVIFRKKKNPSRRTCPSCASSSISLAAFSISIRRFCRSSSCSCWAIARFLSRAALSWWPGIVSNRCSYWRMQVRTLASLCWGCWENDETCKCIWSALVADVNEWREWVKLGKATRYEGIVVPGDWGTIGVAVEARVMVCIAFRPGLSVTFKTIWRTGAGRKWTPDGLKLIEPLQQWQKISRVAMDLARNKICLRSHVTQQILFNPTWPGWIGKPYFNQVYGKSTPFLGHSRRAFIFPSTGRATFWGAHYDTFAGSVTSIESESRSVMSQPVSSRIHVGVGMCKHSLSFVQWTTPCHHIITSTISNLVVPIPRVLGDCLVYSSNTRQMPPWPSHEERFSQSVYASEAPTDRVAYRVRNVYIILNIERKNSFCRSHQKANGLRFSFDSHRWLSGFGFAEVEKKKNHSSLTKIKGSLRRWALFEYGVLN